VGNSRRYSDPAPFFDDSALKMEAHWSDRNCRWVGLKGREKVQMFQSLPTEATLFS